MIALLSLKKYTFHTNQSWEENNASQLKRKGDCGYGGRVKGDDGAMVDGELLES